MEEKMLHVVGNVPQQLEKEIEAAVVSAVATSEMNTPSAVDRLRDKFEVQLNQNRA